MPAENPEAGWDTFDGSDPDITAEFWGPELSSRRRLATLDATKITAACAVLIRSVLIRPVITSPFLKRLGLLAVVGLLLVPVAFALRAPRPASPVAHALSVTTDSSASDSSAPDTAVVIVSLGTDTTTGDEAAEPSETSATSAASATGTTSDAGATGSVRMMSLPILNTPEELAAAERRAACRGTYTVRAGDSWLRIARSGQMDVDVLLAANGARLEDAIHPGVELCIPQGARMPSPPATTTTTAPPTRSGASSGSSSAPRAPTVPSTPAVGASTPASRPTPAQVIAMIREVWPAELQERAIAIARRESSLRADADNGWCCHGVFQIHWNAHRSWMRAHGVTSSAQLLDARTNIEMAYRIYQRAGGWGPWSQ